MSEYLYVCHFSNGHIKVGRSIQPKARIASHVDRVSCLGIELIEHHIVQCVGYSVPAETSLIQQCTEIATKRNKNAWFEGLDYECICELANNLANQDFSGSVDGVDSGLADGEMRKSDAIAMLGGSAKSASLILGCTVHAIYMWGDIIPVSVADRIRGAVIRTSSEKVA